MKKMPHLKYLNLNNCCGIGDNGLLCISHYAQKLEYLSLANCNVSDTGVRYISRLYSLRYLNVANCYAITDLGFIFNWYT